MAAVSSTAPPSPALVVPGAPTDYFSGFKEQILGNGGCVKHPDYAPMHDWEFLDGEARVLVVGAGGLGCEIQKIRCRANCTSACIFPRASGMTRRELKFTLMCRCFVPWAHR